MTTSTILRRVPALCAASALCCAAATTAQARSSYSVSTLSDLFVTANLPIQLDAADKVHSNRKRWSLTLYIVNAYGGPASSPYAARAAYWSPTAAAAAPAVNTYWLNTYYVLAAASDDGRWEAVKNDAANEGTILMRGTTLVKRFDKLAPDDGKEVPEDVNNQGWVVGHGAFGAQGTRPIVWRPDGVAQQLPLGSFGAGKAVSINNNGVIVGQATAQAFWGAEQAVRWVGDAVEPLIPLSQAPSSTAVTVNDVGQVLVAFSGSDNAWNARAAVVGPQGKVTPLSQGKAQVQVFDMNAAGTVVGRVDGRPVLWINGVETDLAAYLAALGTVLPAGWGDVHPVDINDKGSLVVHYASGTGGLQAARLTAQP